MTIKQIYLKYQLPKNLQTHMLAVASLTLIISNNWQGEEINKKDLITCALLHDIAKPVTFDPDKQKQFVKFKKELNQLHKLINNMTLKYGTDEHQAAIQIFKELGFSKNIISLIDNLEWIYLPQLLKENKMEALILNYADMRIGPKGIISLKQRFDELKKREPFKGINKIASLSGILEKYIQEKTKIKLNSITKSDLNNNFEKLLLKQV
ncbi:HD domain-containing protein [Patescibacteria group bacterium]